MNPSIARNYLLSRLRSEKGRNAKQQFTLNARICVIVIIICLLLLWLGSIDINAPDSRYAVVLFASLASLPVVSALTVFITRARALKLRPPRAPHKKGTAGAAGAAGASGALLGSALHRNVPGVTSIIVIIGLPLTIVILTIVASVNIYKLYLLKKYCPELAGFVNTQP